MALINWSDRGPAYRLTKKANLTDLIVNCDAEHLRIELIDPEIALGLFPRNGTTDEVRLESYFGMVSNDDDWHTAIITKNAKGELVSIHISRESRVDTILEYIRSAFESGVEGMVSDRVGYSNFVLKKGVAYK